MTDLVFIEAVHPGLGKELFVRPAGRQAPYGTDPDDAVCLEGDTALIKRHVEDFKKSMQGKYGYKPVAADVVWTSSRGHFQSPDLKPLDHYDLEETESE